jgi:hypothetical protein
MDKPQLPQEILEHIMLLTDSETVKKYCREFPDDYMCLEGNVAFWRELFYRDRGDLRLPLMNRLSWRELCYTQVYDCEYYVTRMPPIDSDEIEMGTDDEIGDYFLSEEEMIKIYESFQTILKDIIKVFDISFNQQTKILTFYIVPNDILDPSEHSNFNENHFYSEIMLIDNYPFREEPLTDEMIAELADMYEENVDVVLTRPLQGPKWQLNFL